MDFHHSEIDALTGLVEIYLNRTIYLTLNPVLIPFDISYFSCIYKLHRNQFCNHVTK